jgi:exodeoxyribonuclease V alpha subunit
MSDLTRLPIGPLAPFHAAGLLAVPDVQVAAAVLRIGGHPLASADPADAAVALGAALCVRALRAGSVCVDLAEGGTPWAAEEAGGGDATVGAVTAAVPWPDPEAWLAAAAAHPLVAQGTSGSDDLPLRLVGSLLYLQRYWQDEQLVRVALRQRAGLVPLDHRTLAEGLARLFGDDQPDRQRLAAALAALRRCTVLAGGPGTGKTTTVARIVALLRSLHGPQLSVALAAPTGKAAARLAEAVGQAAAAMDPADRAGLADLPSSTLHRLLGWRPDASGRFRHDRSNPLPHDVVIVDETSMVSLPLMARLLEAVRPDARLVLVGDPDQLASIDAGAVLGDLVHAPAPPGDTDSAALAIALAEACPREAPEGLVAPAAATGVVTLERNYRFGGAIGALAAAIRAGAPDEVLAVLAAGSQDVVFLDVTAGASAQARAERAVRADVRDQQEQVVAAARAGDAGAALAALEGHRVLCAHREGPHGVQHWNERIAAWTEHLVVHASPGDPWYLGRPLLVTANDPALGLFNGDTGVLVADPSDGVVRAAFARGAGTVLVAPERLAEVQTLHAMTVHRGQGSQFEAVTVVLPSQDSPLLTRELLYTAVTRARRRIRIVGTPEAVAAGVQRRVRRASGLGRPIAG